MSFLYWLLFVAIVVGWVLAVDRILAIRERTDRLAFKQDMRRTRSAL